jgi:hypothetical protein
MSPSWSSEYQARRRWPLFLWLVIYVGLAWLVARGIW